METGSTRWFSAASPDEIGRDWWGEPDVQGGLSTAIGSAGTLPRKGLVGARDPGGFMAKRVIVASKPRLALRLAIVLSVVVGIAGVSVTSASAAPPAGLSHGKRGPLTPRLQLLADPGFAALPARVRAQRLGLPTSGPGSISERSGGRVLVDVRVSDTSASTLQRLRASGAQLTYVDNSLRVVTAAVPVARLSALAAVQPQVLSVEEDLRPMVQAACPTGDFVSEGDSQLNVATGRTNHAVSGAGVTVGVLSDSYNRLNGAATDVTNGELPGDTNPCGYPDPVAVQADHLSSGNDEGRAMAQIVHDLAPGADLRFATANNSEPDFANQIRNLATAGAKVIVDDVTYFDEPMYQDGVVGSAVEDVSAHGVSYFSSAGNENTIVGGHDVASYEAPAYRPTACPASVVTSDPGVLDCHNFNPDPNSAADNTYGLSNSGSIRYVLGWNEPQFGITTDLDLCILSHASGAVQFCSVANNLVTQKAFEAFSNNSLSGSFDLVVARFAGAATPRFKLISFRSALTAVEYPTSSGGDVVGPTIFGHNASRSGATVAAIPYNDANTLETYSSRGPATYCWGPVDGTTPAAALPSCETATVDMSATDGVANSFFGGTSTGVHRFFGTSAAAPHAAAIAALIVQDRPCLHPVQVMQAMTSTGQPIGSFGTDAAGGGRLDADAALTAADATTCDNTPPLVTVTFASPASGWFTTSPVTGQLTATDPSNVASIACTGASVSGLTGLGTTSASATLTVSAEGVNNVSCTATDGFGDAGAAPGSTNTATVQIDTQLPTASPTASPAPNGNGWNNTDVQVTWNWTDPAPGSGIDSNACPSSTTSSGEGAFTVSTTCSDVAGNTASANYSVQVDKTAPTLDPVVTPNPVILGGAATVSSGASDSVSGLDSQSCGSLDTTTIGSKTVTCTATDLAGNTATATVSYVVGAFFGSFVSPLPRSTLTKSVSTIPVKFTLRDANGPLSSSVAAALAANGQVRAVLSGPGAGGPILVTATCTWNSTMAFFQCNLKTPKRLLTGDTNPYLIAAQEKGSTGSFFTVPGSGNPEVVYFR
jgi:Subtilase family